MTAKLYSILLDPQNKRGDRWAYSCLLLAALIFCAPLFRQPRAETNEVDWRQLASIHLIVKKTLLQQRQLPLWTPLLGGGYPLFAYPENDFLNPLFSLSLIFNLWLALKIRVWLYYVIGGLGMFTLTRKIFAFNLAGALFSAGCFAFGSYLPYQVHTGNLYLGSYYYLPWIMYGFSLSSRSRRALLLTVLLLAHLFLGATGLWMACLFLFLLLWSMANSLFRNPAGLPEVKLRTYLQVLVLVALVAAVKLLPLLELLQQSSRAFSDYAEAARGSLSPRGLFHSLVRPGLFLPGKAESGLSLRETLADSTVFIGILPLLMALWVFIFSGRKYRPLLLLLLVFGILTMGAGSPIDLFYWLWHLPLFRSLHYPNKYFSFFIAFLLSAAAGQFFSFDPPLPSQKRLRLLLVLLGAGALLHLGSTTIGYHSGIFNRTPPEIKPEPEIFPVITFWDISPIREGASLDSIPLYRPGELKHPFGGFRKVRMRRDGNGGEFPVLINRYENRQYLTVARNIGVLNWYGWLYLEEKASPRYFLKLGRIDGSAYPPLFYPQPSILYPNPDYRGEAYLELSFGEVQREHVTPNHLILKVATDGPDNLIINQNYYPGWTNQAGKVYNHEGLLGYELPQAGDHRVELFFRPYSFLLGGLISLSTLTVPLVRLVRKRN